MAGKASGKTVERLVVVDETQADRQTIEIYELVTRKMRVGRVPLLFKALAAEKALVPCWNALRPAIRVRAFEEAADDMRARAARASVAGFRRTWTRSSWFPRSRSARWGGSSGASGRIWAWGWCPMTFARSAGGRSTSSSRGRTRASATRKAPRP